MTIDEVVRRYGITTWKKKDGAQQANDSARGIVFVKPLTFMNLSGTPVRLISAWYRTPPAAVLVVSDDMDLPFGKLRMRPGGGHGGHNGLRSVIATIGEEGADNVPSRRLDVGLGNRAPSTSQRDKRLILGDRRRLRGVASRRRRKKTGRIMPNDASRCLVFANPSPS